MGSLSNGLFGGFNGRVGNLVGYMLNGKNVIRLIGKTNKPPTLPKLANYQKMTVVNDFLRPLQNILKLGYRNEVIGTNRNTYNEALSFNKKHALKGEYPNISMDYPKAMLSKGNLPPAEKPSISRTDQGILFHWEASPKSSSVHTHDRAMLVLVFPEAKMISSIYIGARREQGEEFMEISSNLLATQVEAYISFISADGQEISDSVHAGSFAKVSVNDQELQEENQPKAETKHAIDNNEEQPTLALTGTKSQYCSPISASAHLFRPSGIIHTGLSAPLSAHLIPPLFTPPS